MLVGMKLNRAKAQLEPKEAQKVKGNEDSFYYYICTKQKSTGSSDLLLSMANNLAIFFFLRFLLVRSMTLRPDSYLSLYLGVKQYLVNERNEMRGYIQGC